MAPVFLALVIAAPTMRARVGLLITCLVDLFRPSVAFAAVKLLEEADCVVEVPMQTCCGQPAHNGGDARNARDLAKQMIAGFEEYDYVVGPSGSCIGMLREHYPTLFPTDASWRGRAQVLAERCYELTAFLRDVLGVAEIPASYDGVVTYHDSCSGLRELGIRDQPRAFLEQVDGLTFIELDESDVCCGFGGTFCVKYPEISARLVSNKAEKVRATKADTLLGGDLGCLLNIAGRLKRENCAVKVYHVAEILAGMADAAPVGET